MNINEIKNGIRTLLYAEFGKSVEKASEHEYWTSLSRVIMGNIGPDWEATREKYASERMTYYFSAEFLVGRSLLNNLINRDLLDNVRQVVEEDGFDLTRF